MYKKNRLFVFDLDGTLYDSNKIDSENIIASIHSIVQHYHISYAEAEIKLKKARKIEGNNTEKMSLAKTLQTLNIPSEIIEINQIKYIHPELHLSLDTELSTYLQELKFKNNISLYTNTRSSIANRILEAIGLSLSFFDLHLTGDILNEAKPSTAELMRLINMAGTSPTNTIMIGDRWNVDIEPAEKIGVKTFLVNGRDDVIRIIKSYL